MRLTSCVCLAVLLAGATALSAATDLTTGNRPARLLNRVTPEYPYPAGPGFQQPPEGRVLVSLVIGADGAVTSAEIVASNDHAFDKPVLKAIRQWVFAPALRDGKPAAIHATQEIVFRLVDDAPRPPPHLALIGIR